MDQRQAFAKALKTIRKHQGLTQEDFSESSSRTYISMLERGLRTPTLEKIDELSKTLGVHPLVLVGLTYHYMEPRKPLSKLLDSIQKNIETL